MHGVAVLAHPDEAWTPRKPSPTAVPGRRRPDEQYLQRFEGYWAEVSQPYRGITTTGTVVPGLYPLGRTGVSTRPVREAADAFLAELSPDQRRQVALPIDAVEWRQWHGLFSRLWRHGLLLEDLSEVQRTRAMHLVEATLSAEGYRAVEDIRRTNELARELTGLYIDFGQNVYWISIFGVPSDTEPWGWQLDGHHININCFVLGDQLVMTPTFLGAEPTTVRHGKYAGINLFRNEEAHALALMRSLTPAQRRQSIIFDELRLELFTGMFRDNYELRYDGVPVAKLSDMQRQQTIRLIRDWVGYLRPGHAEIKLNEVLRHLDEMYFSWMGGYEDDDAFYYHLHSPVILIEFTHIPGVAMTGSRPSRNHVHSVIRTPNGNDYGKDLLRQHLERSHAGGLATAHGQTGGLAH